MFSFLAIVVQLSCYCCKDDAIKSSISYIERFRSRDQRPYLLNETKESVCITKELNSHRTDLVHQYCRLFGFKVHQYGPAK